MESIKELREFASHCAGGMGGDALRHIADKIEAEVAERYVALPTDADGVPVRIGDVMEWADTSTAEVVGVGDGTFFYVEAGEAMADWSCTEDKVHHHEPTEDVWTIEDTLHELLDTYLDWLESDAPASVMKTRDEIIADYAAKIRGAA